MRPPDRNLYFPQGDSEAFWKDISVSELLQEDIRQISAEGLRLDGQPIPELSYALFTSFARTGTRLDYERVYFERRRRLNTYVFLSLLEPGSARHLENLIEILWAVCGEYTWCLPAHLPADHDPARIDRNIDLFSAETGFTLTEILLLLGERLPLLLRLRIRHEVERKLFRPFMEDGPFQWETARHNWAAVCAGSIGAAALLVVDDPLQLTAILAKTENSMRCYLEGFNEDGACLEGLEYWNYGFGYFTYYSDLLRARSEGRLDWFQEEKVHSIARFQQKCYIGGSYVANFSDSTPQVRVHKGLSHYLANQYSDVERPQEALSASYTDDPCSRFAPALRNLIWPVLIAKGQAQGERAAEQNQGQRLEEEGQEKLRDWQPASYYLSDASWLVSRHRSKASAFGFAAKGGHNGEPHNHNDLGHFILYGLGEIYAADLGSGEYTADYFGDGRYGYDCNGSQGHSVPIINGQYQLEGPEHSAAVLHASAGSDRDELTLELSGAYRVEGLKRLVRAMVWHKEEWPRLELTDEYRYTGTAESWKERFVTWRRPEAVRPGVVRIPGTADGGVEIHYDGQILEPEIASRTYCDHFGRKTVWYSVDFCVRQPREEGRFSFVFQFVDSIKISKI